MIKNLKTRITLLILGGTLFAIILVSVITNINLFGSFNAYMKNEQKNRINEILELIKNTYSLENAWTESNLKSIQFSPLIKEFDVVIRTLDGKIVFAHPMEYDMMDMHKQMMGWMKNHMMDGNTEPSGYVSEKYDLVVKGKSIGSVEIGYVGPFTISEREIKFSRQINTSIIYAAVIAVMASVALGIYSSRIMSNPILKITDAANQIRKGNLDIQVKVPTGVTELKQLSESINHLARSLSEQEKLRKRLTQDISHELRTPLTILQSHIEAISDGIWEPTPEKLAICKNEVERLTKLVEQLKDLTDIENHIIAQKIERYNLSESIMQILEAFTLEFKEKDIKLVTNITQNVYIYGDKDKIGRAIINIISNALKYTNPGGSVYVSLNDAKNDIKIIIEDTGIGIDQKDLPYIFERFYRSDESRSRKTGGTGIGLTIAKTLIETHGGKITVESQKGRGTRFTVVLPKNA
ncbi:MAG: hypothetical protein PWQ68_2530 [Thermoanaerobacteraceae bacterium]|nr:hypothetical protein [Thermoanaerobacteraceae bacterium]